MSPPRTLSDIAATVQADAEAIQRYVDEQHKQSNGHCGTTFYGGSEVPLPPDLESKRQKLFDAMEEITFLLRGPVGHVLYQSNPIAIERFEIATKLGPEETLSFSELAQRCHLDLQDFTHLIRAAIAHRIFESAGGTSVKHNASSRAISGSSDLRDWIHLVRKDVLPANTGLIDAMAKYPGASEPNESGWSLSHNTNKAIFEYAQMDHELATRFVGSMRLLAKGSVTELPLVAAGLGVEKLQGTIVDVGGSTGSLMCEILRAAPLSKGIVQDLPNVIEQGKAPPDLQERLTFQVSDFFKEQQEKNADVYLFRKILHDWSDARCAQIIGQLVPALKVGARVIVNDICVPVPGEVPARREQDFRDWSLTMKAFTNGHERSEEEWIALFKGVDQRFEFESTKGVSGAVASIISFTWGTGS